MNFRCCRPFSIFLWINPVPPTHLSASFLSDYYFDYYYNIINHHDLKQNSRKKMTTQNRHFIFGNTLLESFRRRCETLALTFTSFFTKARRCKKKRKLFDSLLLYRILSRSLAHIMRPIQSTSASMFLCRIE